MTPGKVRPRILIAEPRHEVADRLREGLSDSRDISVVEMGRDQFTALPLLDAEYLPLPYAERWGSQPLPFYKAEVLKTATIDAELPGGSVPRYVVTGVTLPGPLGAVDELRIIITAVLDAIRSFNSQNTEQIRTVGFWSQFLLRHLSPEEAAGTIRSAYEGNAGGVEIESGET